MQTKVDFNFILQDLVGIKLSDEHIKVGQRLINYTFLTLDSNEVFDFFLKIATDTFNISQMLVPVDTGVLKASGVLEVFVSSFKISYTAPYASFVHEIIGNKHQAPTQSKFLQDAFIVTLHTLITNYGIDNVPDFYIDFNITEKDGISLEISKISESGATSGMTWRRFLGL